MKDFDSAPKDIDDLFAYFPQYDTFRLFDIINMMGFIREEKHRINENDAVEILLVRHFKYAESVGKTDLFFKLTDLGRVVKATGGHFAYLKKLAVKDLADAERQQLSDKKLKWDVKNGERIFKTYWWTFGSSIAAFLLSLFNLIYNLFIRKH